MATRQQTLAMFMLVALAFAATTMTALRPPGVPAGFSELILIGCMIAHVPMGLGVHGGNVPNRFVPFLLLLFLAMLPGYFGTLTRVGHVPFALYNLIASAWVVLLFTYLHFGFDFRRDELDRLVQLFLGFSTLYFVVIILLSVVEPSMVYLQDDIVDLQLDAQAMANAMQEEPVFRLVGFSTNPNQLALHGLVCSFFALALWRRNGRLFSLVALGTAATVGLMAKSDAFLFAEVALVGTAVVMGILFGRSVVLGLVVLVPLATAGVVMLPLIVNTLQEIAGAADQDLTRFTLWENGIAAGLEHPFIGLGPGAWSYIEGPLEPEEAHNSAIDYFSNAGLLGATVLLIGTVSLLYRALFAQRAVLLAGAVAIILFAMFHNVLRQPIMWLGLYYVAQNVWPGTQPAKATGQRRRRRVQSSSRGNVPAGSAR